MFTRRRLAAGLAVTALLAAAALTSPDAVLSRALALVDSPLFPVVLVALYLVRPFLAWPITLLSALVGYRYGLVVGVPVALVGVVGTSLLPYVAGARLPSDGRVVGRLADGSERFFATTGGLRGVIAARLAPTPAEPVNVAAGAGGVTLSAFVLGTLVGELPWTIAAVFLGHSLGTFTPGQVAVDLRLAAAGALAALALVAGPAYRRLSA